MPMKRYKPEQIVNLLRQIEVEIANGRTYTDLQGNGNHPTDLLPLAEGIRRIKAGSSQASQGVGAGDCEAKAAGGGAFFGLILKDVAGETSKP